MPFSLEIPFYGVHLRFAGGNNLIAPLLDPNAWFINQRMDTVAAQYAQAFQRKALAEGNYTPLLEEFQKGPFLRDELEVHFSNSDKQGRFPAFSVRFSYFFVEDLEREQCWGILPTLGLEGYAPDLVALRQQLEKSVHLDFTRNRRLAELHGLVEALWLEVRELNQVPMALETYNPAELDSGRPLQEKSWLQQVATPWHFDQVQAYGRDREIQQMTRALQNPFNKNILLVGPHGVGKSALLQELSRIAPLHEVEQQFWETTASNLIKELTADTGWQDNMIFLTRELKEKGGILVVRNLMELFEVGQYEGNNVSMAEYLLPLLSRGEFTLLSECTEEERAQIELRSPSYLSFFQLIQVEEPPTPLASEIIQWKVDQLQQTHRVQLSEEAVQEVIRLNKRFTPYAGIPGRPIRFLESLLLQKADSFSQPSNQELHISRAEVIHQFCQNTGMPTFMVDPEVEMDPTAVLRFFSDNIFGQDHAVTSVVNVLATVKAAMTQTGKPIASFLLVGPTGVGKTELAKVLAAFMFGSRDRMIRFDMSEYSDAYNIMRLTNGQGGGEGLLTSAVRREPFCVLLFDEIEKAHPDFSDLLLQVLGEGRLSDGRGQLVNFCSTVIIMTSNIGAARIQENPISILLEATQAQAAQLYLSAVQKHFRPELFNRIDQVIPFEALGPETVAFVVEREIEALKRREGIRFRKMELQLPESIIEHLARKGYDRKYGARQLQRTIRESLIVPLAKALNEEDPDDQLIVQVHIENDEIRVAVEADPLGLDLLMEELTKINLADKSSDLRREIQQLESSHFFVRLMSELDILEQKRKKLGESKFWAQGKTNQKYTRYLHTKQKMDALLERIRQLEMESSMASLGMQAFAPDSESRIKAWETDLKTFKLDLYRSLHPKADQCYVGIYGKAPAAFLEFYLPLFNRPDWSVHGHSVWFEEAHYREVLPNYLPIGDKVFSDKERYPDKMLYRYHFWENLDNMNLEIETDPWKLFGLEMTIKGPAAQLMLKGEAGLHEWEVKDTRIPFHVTVATTPFETPTAIHRQEFYRDENPRRLSQAFRFKDTKYKIEEDWPRAIQLERLQSYMEDRFFKQVFAALR